MIRRSVALMMLLTLIFCRAEGVWGMVHDGAVHHESSSEALVHSANSPDAHMHEDDAPPGPDHQHGSSGDHCTHQHGTLIPATGFPLTLVADRCDFYFPDFPGPLDHEIVPFAPPPQL